jgi:hypothetical protein
MKDGGMERWKDGRPKAEQHQYQSNYDFMAPGQAGMSERRADKAPRAPSFHPSIPNL